MASASPVPEDRRGVRRITGLALAFEVGLAALALLLGWMLGHWPLPGVDGSAQSARDVLSALAWGVLATVPMLLVPVAVERLPWNAFRELDRVVDRVVVPLFARCTLTEMAALSLAAGIGEEMLFRGLLQDGLAAWIGPQAGPWIGLLAAALVFGACHGLTWGYAVLAAIIGIYLGGLLILSGSLLVPLVAHALYDFFALAYLVRIRPRARSAAGNG